MTSPFLESSWKIKLGSKGQAVSSVSGFWVIVNNLGEGPNYSSNSEDCLLLLIIIIIIFLRIFSRAYFSYNLAFIATKIHRNVGTIATWVAMTFCDVGYDRIWVISKKQDFTKKHNTPSIFTLFSIFFFLFCSRVQGKAHGRHPSRPINHRFQTRGNRKWRFSRKCKISYILKNYLTYMKSDDFCGLSVKK